MVAPYWAVAYWAAKHSCPSALVEWRAVPSVVPLVVPLVAPLVASEPDTRTVRLALQTAKPASVAPVWAVAESVAAASVALAGAEVESAAVPLVVAPLVERSREQFEPKHLLPSKGEQMTIKGEGESKTLPSLGK